MASGVLKIKIIGEANELIGELGKAEGALGKLGTAAGIGGAAIAASLAAGFAAVVKFGGDFNEAYNTIRQGTGATGDALKGLETDFKQTFSQSTGSMEDVSTAIADLNTRLGLTGKPLQTLADQFIDLNKITGEDVAGSIESVTRVFGDWGVAAGDQSKSLDMLFKVSQNTGIGVNDLSNSIVSYGAPLRNLGFSMEESAALFGKWNKEGVNTETIFAGLKAGVGKLAKEGKDVPSTFREIVESIKNAGDASEATSIAIETFGQDAGPDLADAIRGGKFELDELMKAVADSPETIDGLAAETETLGDKFTKLKNGVLVKLEPILTKLFDGMLVAFDKIAPVIGRIAHIFQAFFAVINGDEAADQFGGFAGSAAHFGEVVLQVFGWMRDNIPPIIERVQEILSVVFAWISENIPPVLEMIVAAFEEKFAPIWPKLVELVTTAFEAIKTVIETVIIIIQFIWEQFGGQLVSILKAVWDTIWGVLGGAIDILTGIFKLITSVLTGDWSGAWDAIKQILSGAWKAIWSIVEGAWKVLLNILSIAWDAIKGGASLAWDGIKWAISAVFDAIWGLAKAAVDKIIDFFKSLPGGIKDGIVGIASVITAPFRDAFNEIAALWNRTVGSISFQVPSWVPGMGGNGFDVPNIPTFAEGGLAFKPMLAIVGDHKTGGAEIITPEDKMRQVVREEGGLGRISIGTINFGRGGPEELVKELDWMHRTGGRL